MKRALALVYVGFLLGCCWMGALIAALHPQLWDIGWLYFWVASGVWFLLILYWYLRDLARSKHR